MLIVACQYIRADVLPLCLSMYHLMFQILFGSDLAQMVNVHTGTFSLCWLSNTLIFLLCKNSLYIGQMEMKVPCRHGQWLYYRWGYQNNRAHGKVRRRQTIYGCKRIWCYYKVGDSSKIYIPWNSSNEMSLYNELRIVAMVSVFPHRIPGNRRTWIPGDKLALCWKLLW